MIWASWGMEWSSRLWTVASSTTIAVWICHRLSWNAHTGRQPSGGSQRRMTAAEREPCIHDGDSPMSCTAITGMPTWAGCGHRSLRRRCDGGSGPCRWGGRRVHRVSTVGRTVVRYKDSGSCMDDCRPLAGRPIRAARQPLRRTSPSTSHGSVDPSARHGRIERRIELLSERSQTMECQRLGTGVHRHAGAVRDGSGSDCVNQEPLLGPCDSGLLKHSMRSSGNGKTCFWNRWYVRRARSWSIGRNPISSGRSGTEPQMRNCRPLMHR